MYASAKTHPLTDQSSLIGGVMNEDAQLQQALSMSMSQDFKGQETGVVDASGNQLRPATREYYDTRNWSMTLPGHDTREIIQNPDPEFRKRELGAPAFIKPLNDEQYLPALLTILHAIPIAKEALLARDLLLPDYGHHTEWWDGVSAQGFKIIDLEQSIENENLKEVIFESQRLMAFLEQTNRAYGSAEVLAKLRPMREFTIERQSAEDAFLEVWQKAMEETHSGLLADVFQVTCVVKHPTIPHQNADSN